MTIWSSEGIRTSQCRKGRKGRKLEKGHAPWEGTGMVTRTGCPQDGRWSLWKCVTGEKQPRQKGNDGSRVEFIHRQSW